MGFWRCYYHIVWATKNREPVMTAPLEQVAIAGVCHKSSELHCEIFAINGMPDHLHVAVAIPPSLAVSDWAKHVKGVSSRDVNATFANLPFRFRWQESFSALTFGEKVMDVVVRYIEGQKQHHARGALEPYLERIDD